MLQHKTIEDRINYLRDLKKNHKLPEPELGGYHLIVIFFSILSFLFFSVPTSLISVFVILVMIRIELGNQFEKCKLFYRTATKDERWFYSRTNIFTYMFTGRYVYLDIVAINNEIEYLTEELKKENDNV